MGHLNEFVYPIDEWFITYLFSCWLNWTPYFWRIRAKLVPIFYLQNWGFIIQFDSCFFRVALSPDAPCMEYLEYLPFIYPRFFRQNVGTYSRPMRHTFGKVFGKGYDPCLQENYNTPIEHTPGKPPKKQPWKESLHSLLVKVARGVFQFGVLKQPLTVSFGCFVFPTSSSLMPTFARYSRNQASTWKETTEGEAWWKYPVFGVWKWSTNPWDIEK